MGWRAMKPCTRHGGGALLAVLLGACGSPVASVSLAAKTTDEAGGAPTSCADGAAAATLSAQTQAHLDLAFAVRDRLQNAAVVAFAEKTVTDCSLALLQCAGALRADGIASAPNAHSHAIALSAELAAQSVASASGAALDRAYVANEALTLAQDVGAIDRLITPNVHDARLAQVVANTRDLVEQRGAIARGLESMLAGTCGD
jgi:predicted outer membrane protein